MRNKPNFQKAKMKLNFYLTKDYEKKCFRGDPQNKPNQTQFYPPLADLSRRSIGEGGNAPADLLSPIISTVLNQHFDFCFLKKFFHITICCVLLSFPK